LSRFGEVNKDTAFLWNNQVAKWPICLSETQCEVVLTKYEIDNIDRMVYKPFLVKSLICC